MNWATQLTAAITENWSYFTENLKQRLDENHRLPKEKRRIINIDVLNDEGLDVLAAKIEVQAPEVCLQPSSCMQSTPHAQPCLHMRCVSNVQSTLCMQSHSQTRSQSHMLPCCFVHKALRATGHRIRRQTRMGITNFTSRSLTKNGTNRLVLLSVLLSADSVAAVSATI